MKILHSSDLHGSYRELLALLESPDYDVWVDTGDFFPNKTRGNYRVEASYQERWFNGYKGLGERIKARLNGRQAVVVGGNHDYVSLTRLLIGAGVDAHDVASSPVIDGLQFSGFREVPWDDGTWNGETHCFDPQMYRVRAAKPDILLTHAPPSGILSDGWGIPVLSSYLFYEKNQVKLHLFGHVHEHGGEEATESGIRFVNGATKIRKVDHAT